MVYLLPRTVEIFGEPQHTRVCFIARGVRMLVFAFSENKQLGYNRGGIVDDDLPRRRGTVAERGDADSEEEG